MKKTETDIPTSQKTRITSNELYVKNCLLVSDKEIEEYFTEFNQFGECSVLKGLYRMTVDEWKKTIIESNITFYALYEKDYLIGIGRVTDHPQNVDTGSIGYGIRPSMRRKGYGTRFVNILADIADRMGVIPWACIREDNLPSIKTIEQAGWIKSGIKYRWRDGNIAIEYHRR